MFEPKFSGGSDSRIHVNLTHGDLYGMSRQSQDIYRHSIQKDYSTQPRISITFRLINPPTNPSYGVLPSFPSLPSADSSPSLLSAHTQPPRLSLPATPHPSNSQPGNTNRNVPTFHTPHSNTPHPSNNKPTNPKHVVSTLYISSSMFRNLNASKLCTDSQTAAVLFYPGATAGRILSNLEVDRNFSKIDPAHVEKVYILCGTNNVDKILGIPRSHDKSIVEDRYTNFSNRELSQTKVEMRDLLIYLNKWSPSADINVLNILPRVSRTRNMVINELNSYISEHATNSKNIKYISTELNRHLFCNSQGYRNNQLFNFRGEDNVHLNTLGKSKLAKFLKYHAHNS